MFQSPIPSIDWAAADTISLLVFGRDGQLATELGRLAGPGVLVTALSRAEADLTDPAACAAAIAATDADAVINAAAYTAVDRAEAEEEVAALVNAAAPAAMARAAASRGIPFVHVSTDYVYGGAGTRPIAPGATAAPLNAYGRTKLAGDLGVIAAGGRHAILRASWVFSAHGRNFATTMLGLGAARERVRVVADQVGGPTPAADLAAALVTVARALRDGRGRSGIYHFSGAPDVSWAGFAREIFRQAALGATVEDIPSSAYPTPARRPANSRLDCAATRAAFGIGRPDWRRGLARVLAELGAA